MEGAENGPGKARKQRAVGGFDWLKIGYCPYSEARVLIQS